MTLSPKRLYDLLLTHFGHQNWWPIDKEYHQKHRSDPRFEIMIGAILTQNTAWANVEKALENLKKNRIFTINALNTVDGDALKTMIQPSGFFNQKARRLKNFASYLQQNYKEDLQIFFCRNLQEIRQELLTLNGIGPETADSILLYAGNQPIFVIDAYTKRISTRIPLPINGDTYDEIQNFFEKELQKTIHKNNLVPVYKELHALLVELAKNHCRKKPGCATCPIQTLCKKSL
jgi:endonuclease-3 related protein